mmetsp:Transcript_18416/g.31499  ORF Transcript_18416/g.31499 Transcript_18416/m.31499 type:complete len:105 (+) Transcript_18416:145-459(+)
MGNMVINSFGLSLIFGLNSSLETLVSQGFGAKKIRLCGVYLQRGRTALLILYIPIFFILLSSKHILLFLGQNPAVVEYSYTYILAYMPGIFIFGMHDLQRKFLV